MTNDTTRQVVNVAALAATIAVNGLANALPLGGRTTGEISNQFPLAITPPGYVFGIWGVIYTGLTAFTVYQALPGQRTNPRLRRLGWLFTLSCAANVGWLLLWHYGFYRTTLVAMILLLLTLAVIVARLAGSGPASTRERWLVDGPFRVYLGWIAVATLVNASVALYNAGWGGAGMNDATWTVILLGLGAALAAWFGFGLGDPVLPAVVSWAFVGIALQQQGSAPVAPAAWLAAVITVGATLGGLFRNGPLSTAASRSGAR
jgi:tryptophan-rich sensory protein